MKIHSYKMIIIFSFLLTPVVSFGYLPTHLGEGFSSVGGLMYGEKRLNCVLPVSSNVIADLEGGHLQINFNSFMSQSEFEKTLIKDTSIDHGLRASFFGNATNPGGRTPLASASLKISKKTKKLHQVKTEYNQKIIEITISKTFHEKSLFEHRFNPSVLEYLKDNPEKFYEKCGDEFVSGVYPGIAVQGYLVCNFNSHEENNEETSFFKSELEVMAETPTNHIDGKNNFQLDQFMRTFQKELTNHCHLDVEAIGGKGNISSNMESFASSAISYVSNASIHDAVVIGIVTRKYEDFILDNDVQIFVQGLSEKLKKFRDLVNLIKKNIEMHFLNIISIELKDDISDSDKKVLIKKIKEKIMIDEKRIIDLTKLRKKPEISKAAAKNIARALNQHRI